MNGIKPLGISLLTAFLVLCPGMLRAGENSTDLPSIVGQVQELQGSIAALEDSGLINHGRAKSLGKKLDKVTRALTDLNNAEAAGDVSVQQASFLKALQRAIDALLDFISELTRLVTDLPSEVVQPIIDAAIALLRDLFGLLLG